MRKQTVRQQLFTERSSEKNYTLSDEDAKAIEDKYNANDTLTNEDKATAIQKEKDEKKKADIDKQMATDESKAAITTLGRKWNHSSECVRCRFR